MCGTYKKHIDIAETKVSSVSFLVTSNRDEVA